MCLEGDFVIAANGEKTVVNKGETVLIPASIDEVVLYPEAEGTIMEVYL
jgi:mannose-6-phosphate isomerase